MILILRDVLLLLLLLLLLVAFLRQSLDSTHPAGSLGRDGDLPRATIRLPFFLSGSPFLASKTERELSWSTRKPGANCGR
jgi:hypothetical protein